MRMSAGRFFVGLILLSSSSALAVCNNPPTANTDVYNIAKNTTLNIYDGTLKATTQTRMEIRSPPTSAAILRAAPGAASDRTGIAISRRPTSQAWFPFPTR